MLYSRKFWYLVAGAVLLVGVGLRVAKGYKQWKTANTVYTYLRNKTLVVGELDIQKEADAMGRIGELDEQTWSFVDGLRAK